MTGTYKTLLAGFGQIAAGYSDDPRYVAHVSCPTHAHALTRHPGFDWLAVVDPLSSALEVATTRWGISCVASSAEELSCAQEIEVAVLSTPPEVRLEIIDALPGLKAVFVEKPLASDLFAARHFLDVCRERGIIVQANITRRGDAILHALATGDSALDVGTPRAMFGVYGNGLANMATHGVDLVRMLYGEVRTAQALPGGRVFAGGPLKDDVNLPFVLTLDDGVQAVFMPLHFDEYREAALDIWGEKGRLQLVQEGLVLLHSGVVPCRSFDGVNEVPSDCPEKFITGYGEALSAMYDNLHQVLEGRTVDLFCSGDEALATMRVVHAVLESHRRGGTVVEVATLGDGLQTVYFAHDPGAAELVAHLFLHRASKDVVLLGQGYAPGVYRKLGLKFEEISDTDALLAWMESHVDMVGRIVSGTSQSVDADCRLWRWAAEQEIPVEAHVDHWMNPVERFVHLGGLSLPDEVHVVDEESRQTLLAAGAAVERVLVSGQPVMEAKAQVMRELRRNPVVRERVKRVMHLDEATEVHVFVSENLTELGLRSRFGFDELDAFLAYRADLGCRPVVIKVHPKESEDKWWAFLAREGIMDCRVVTGRVHPEELAAVADSVGGLFSIMLLEAHLAGVPVVSCQPGTKVKNPMDNPCAGGIRTILSGPPKKE